MDISFVLYIRGNIGNNKQIIGVVYTGKLWGGQDRVFQF
jgi:hypothetical protein